MEYSFDLNFLILQGLLQFVIWKFVWKIVIMCCMQYE